MTSTIPILLYHSVNDAPPGDFGPFTVNRAQLAAHLDRVAELGYTTVTIEQLLGFTTRQMAPPERTVVITFDDGFADFASAAWPALQARGMGASLYVTAGTVGGRSEWLAPLGAGDLPMLSRAELTDLAAEGCEIGAHSMTHPQLDCVPVEVARREIRDSKDYLEQALGCSVDSFAYPHGYHDRRVKRLVVEAGYTSATAVRNALSYPEDDLFALARVTVMSDFGPEHIDRVLNGRGVPRAKAGEKWRTKGWRQVRRQRYRRAHLVGTS